MNILNVIDAVLEQDISDEAFADAVQAQVCAMAQLSSDESSAFSLD